MKRLKISAKTPCPVCGEPCASEQLLAETTTAFDQYRTYVPLSVLYYHADGKRCSVKLAEVVSLTHKLVDTAYPSKAIEEEK